jgi:sugar/nucleoside kinase (ribokinase family)
VCAQVIVASAAGLAPGAVVDTTGAGDAFIGSVIYGIVTGMQPEQMLQLAAVVAACKCTMLGARPGLPRREQLDQQLLGGVDAAAGPV